jgi:phosphoglycerate dehydrogenase-like enzyme
MIINTPRATVELVSENVIALRFSLTRSVARQAALTRDGIWDRDAAPVPIELSGLVMGLVGMGQIPRAIVNFPMLEDITRYQSRLFV